MSESVKQPFQSTDTHSRVADREFNGELNRASAQGAKFALLLAMLEQDYLHRPKLLASETAEDTQADTLTNLSYYPSTPLKADCQHWTQANFASENIVQETIKSAQLWLVMHPQPLSLYNDPKRLDDEVVANCDIHTQQRLKDTTNKDLQVDETELYDILQGMEAEIDTAA